MKFIAEDNAIAGQAYFAAIQFFGEFPSDEMLEASSLGNTSTTEEAWQYLYCDNSSYCSAADTTSALNSIYHPHEVEEIIKTAKEYVVAIETGDWQKLDF